MTLPDDLRSKLEQLRQFDPAEVQGRQRLGALEFSHAPRQIQTIVNALSDLDEEDWEDIDPNLRPSITGQTDATISLIEQMMALSAADPGAASTKDSLENQLASYAQWFRTNVDPIALRAKIRRGVQESLPSDTREELEGLRKQFDETKAELLARRNELSGIVEAQREAAGVAGAADLSADWAKEATKHEKEWKKWGRALAIPVAIGGSILTVWIAHPPKDATNAQIASRLLVDVLVVGLLLYVVRILSLQFRVHRHLEAVATNKSAALSTFNRIVSVASEPEIRTSIATVLAQYVFTTEEAGFIDAGSEHITLIERVLGPAVQRITPS